MGFQETINWKEIRIGDDSEAFKLDTAIIGMAAGLVNQVLVSDTIHQIKAVALITEEGIQWLNPPVSNRKVIEEQLMGLYAISPK